MSLGWQGLAVGVLFGVIGTIAGAIYMAIHSRKQSRQSYSPQRSSNDSEPNHIRNLTCALCNKYLQKNQQRLNCGHSCHTSCYEQRTVQKKRCTICGENKDENEPVAHSSRESNITYCYHCLIPIEDNEQSLIIDCDCLVHDRCHQDFLKTIVNIVPNSTENHNAESSTRNRQKSSIVNKCNYCGVPIGESSESITLDCQHRIHKDCRRLSMFMKCILCSNNS